MVGVCTFAGVSPVSLSLYVYFVVVVQAFTSLTPQAVSVSAGHNKMIATLSSGGAGVAGLLTHRRRFILLSFLWLSYGLLAPEAHSYPGEAGLGSRQATVWLDALRGRLYHGSGIKARNVSYLNVQAMEDMAATHKRSPASAAYLVSPVSQQVLEVGGQLDSSRDIQYEFVEPAHDYDGQCLTLRSSVQVTREELDQATGKPTRKCRGSVPLNRCEGACSSYIEPAVMSHSNLRQDCLCCNEGSLRRIQVRLNDCYATNILNENERLLRPPLDPIEMSYMDVELSEPIQCKCRHCRPFL